MANPILNIISTKSDKFRTEEIQQYDLSLLFDAQELILSITDLNNQCLYWEQYLKAPQATWGDFLQEVQKKSTLCQGPHQTASTVAIFRNNYFNLLPTPYFRPQDIAVHLQLNADFDTKQQDAWYENLNSNEIIVLAAADSVKLDWVKACFHQSTVAFKHHTTVLLNYLLEKRNDFLPQEIFITVEAKHINIAAFSSSELQLINRFEVDNAQQLIKYILMVIQQLNFDRTLCKVSVIGNLAKHQTSIQELGKYIKNVHQQTPEHFINYSELNQKVAYQDYFETFRMI